MTLATELAPRGIRANVVHPTNCNTDMLQSEPMYKSFRPDLETPDTGGCRTGLLRAAGHEDAVDRARWTSATAVLLLASDEARYVTGMQLRVDAGGYLKWYDYHISSGRGEHCEGFR